MKPRTLVLLPGMMCDARLFAPQVKRLSAALSVHVPVVSAPTIEGMAEQALDGIEPGPIAIAGLSMGGIIAMELARRHGERVTHLALLDTNHLADPVARRPVRQRQIDDVLAGKLHDVIVDEMKPNYLAHCNRDNTQLLDLLIEMALGLGPKVFVEQSRALLDRVDQSNTLAAYQGRPLVLCGSEDALCPPERHRAMAKLLRTEVVEVSKAGHISTLEQSDKVTDALWDWLEL